MAQFKDHFSGHASEYSRYRPSYPEELFEHLVGLCLETHCAWDCATGNGQVAGSLSPRFDVVIATDASPMQIEHAAPYDNVRYEVAAAEHTEIDSGSVDLVTVGQALHWFKLDEFFDEATRVLKPGGVIAAWTYHLNKVNAEIDAVTFELFDTYVGDYWPPERALVESEYRDIQLPFENCRFPNMVMQVDWTLADMLGYFNTWSAVKRFQADQGYNPVTKLMPEFNRAWGDPTRTRRVTWPLSGRVGRKPV